MLHQRPLPVRKPHTLRLGQRMALWVNWVFRGRLPSRRKIYKDFVKKVYQVRYKMSGTTVGKLTSSIYDISEEMFGVKNGTRTRLATSVDHADGSGECIGCGGRRKVSEGNWFVQRTAKNLASCSCMKIWIGNGYMCNGVSAEISDVERTSEFMNSFWGILMELLEECLLNIEEGFCHVRK